MSLVGKTIGHIRIMDILGKGGMGEVYVGFDETLKRKVAFKALGEKSRLDPEAKDRFLREARVLSKLDHPNICQIHDYIEGKESDFLVLEFIEGKNLGQALEGGLDKSLKLKIAEQIAQVLVAAHEKGIVHRDLKPSNIMLMKSHEIKVLDFGIACLIESKPGRVKTKERKDIEPIDFDLAHTLESETLTITPSQPPSDEEPGSIPVKHLPVTFKTKHGTVMGTPLYMSPEQARGDPVSAASDMYSLGLMLQELFSGQSPYEEAIDLTTLLKRAVRGETRPVKGISSDLAALINRLKSPVPMARPSAVETAEQLRRIREKPKRRIRNLIASGIVAAFVLTGIIYILNLRRERSLAIQARDEVTSVVEFLVDLFEVSDPGEARGNTITAREILSKGAKEVTRELQAQPLTRARLMDTIGTVYCKLGLYTDSEPLLRKALEIREEHLGKENLQVAESFFSIAVLYEQKGKYKEAEHFSRDALEIREAALAPDDPDVAESLHNLALIIHKQGNFDEAEPLYKRALEIREKALGSNHPDVSESLRDLGVLYYMKGQYNEAEPLYRRALMIRESILGPDHPDVGRNLNSLAALYYTLGRYNEAEPLYKRALRIREKTLGSDHPEVAICLNNLAILYYNQGNLDEAEVLYKQALEIREKALGPNHPDVAESLESLAALYFRDARYGDAELLYKRALAIQKKTLRPDHPKVASCLNNLALLYTYQGKTSEAEPIFKEALEVREKAFGPDHPDVAQSLKSLAYFYLDNDKYDEAEPLYKRALSISEKTLGSDHISVASILGALAYICDKKGQYDEAANLYQRALAIREKYPDSYQLELSDTLFSLALMYHHRLNRLKEAEALYKRAIAIQEKVLSPDSSELIKTLKESVSLLRALGKENEALKLEARIKEAPEAKTQRKK